MNPAAALRLFPLGYDNGYIPYDTQKVPLSVDLVEASWKYEV